MIRLTSKLADHSSHDTTLTLTYEQRVKSRLRALLDDGREAGVFLERGVTLKHGDCLAVYTFAGRRSRPRRGSESYRYRHLVTEEDSLTESTESTETPSC